MDRANHFVNDGSHPSCRFEEETEGYYFSPWLKEVYGNPQDQTNAGNDLKPEVERKIASQIDWRGLKGDFIFNPGTNGADISLRAGIAGLSGVASPYIKAALDQGAAHLANKHLAAASTESTIKRLGLAPVRAWNTHVAGESWASLLAKPANRSNLAGNDLAVKQLLFAQERGVGTPAWHRFASSALQTTMIQAAISADRKLADLLELDGAARSTGYQQFLAPAAMAIGEKISGKLGYLALATAASRGLEQMLPAAPDRISAPIKTTDSKDMGVLGTTLMIAQGLKNPVARVGVVTAGVVATKLVHALEDNMPNSLNSPYFRAREARKVDVQ